MPGFCSIQFTWIRIFKPGSEHFHEILLNSSANIWRKSDNGPMIYNRTYKHKTDKYRDYYFINIYNTSRGTELGLKTKRSLKTSIHSKIVNQFEANRSWFMIGQIHVQMFRRADDELYVHYTCATDTENAKVVFSCVKDTIEKHMLKAVGLF